MPSILVSLFGKLVNILDFIDGYEGVFFGMNYLQSFIYIHLHNTYYKHITFTAQWPEIYSGHFV